MNICDAAGDGHRQPGLEQIGLCFYLWLWLGFHRWVSVDRRIGVGNSFYFGDGLEVDIGDLRDRGLEELRRVVVSDEIPRRNLIRFGKLVLAHRRRGKEVV